MSDARPRRRVGDDAVRADALARLLDRPAPPEYLESWVRALRRAVFSEADDREHTAVLFRVGEQWLALDTSALIEVQALATVRSVPGRTSDVFRGLVSIRGELQLCADLHGLLGVPRDAEEGDAPSSRTARTLVVVRDGEVWTFEVDEVRGVEQYGTGDLLAPQATVAKSVVHYTDGLIRLGPILAARLSPDRLFDGLDRSLA